MPAWAVALLSAVVGGTAAYAGSLHLHRLRAREEDRRQRRNALGSFFGRLLIVVAVVQQWPPDTAPTPLEQLRAWIVGRSERLSLHDWVRTQERLREVFGEDFYKPVFALLEAYASLRLLPLDARVRESSERALNYVERLAALRTEELKDEWPDVRSDFLRAVEASGDAPAIETIEMQLLGEATSDPKQSRQRRGSSSRIEGTSDSLVSAPTASPLLNSRSSSRGWD